MIQAMMAPSTPVAEPKLLGSVKTPPPTIEPMTIPTSVGTETFCCVCRSVDSIGCAERYRIDSRRAAKRNASH
jgi:hypothetical protein